MSNMPLWGVSLKQALPLCRLRTGGAGAERPSVERHQRPPPGGPSTTGASACVPDPVKHLTRGGDSVHLAYVLSDSLLFFFSSGDFMPGM